jgi:2-hydroxychromene-2-carboxylate isomerase
MPAKPVLFFSFRSPYSWLAIERLRKARPDMHRAINFIPIWNPDTEFTAALAAHKSGFHYAEMSSVKHRYVLTDVRRLARRDRLKITWPIDRNPHWELPNLAWLAARAQGADERLYTAMVTARWEGGSNICAPQTLRRLALEAGLDPDMPTKALRDADVRAEALHCLQRAWDEDIFGFPYFRIGPQRYWGIDRLPDFLAAWQQPAQRPSPARDLADVEPVPAFGEDASGGCG